MKKHRAMRLVLGVVLFGGAVFDVATLSAQDDVLSACVDTDSGDLRLVSAGENCKESEYSIHWNVTGPAGPRGMQGAPGFSTLFRPATEPPSFSCPHGGHRIDGGVDNGDGGGRARNGVLELGEVDFRFSICDGAPGVPGPQGQAGMACWDLNGNGIASSDEDVNRDGNVNAQDCRGPEGEPGNLVLAGTSCGPGQAVIGFDDGGNPVCAARFSADVEVCDGQDNDLDGIADDGFAFCVNGSIAPHTDGAVCLSGYADLDRNAENGCERDSDADFIFDDADNCDFPNFFQVDSDGDGKGDVCDPDAQNHSGLWVLDKPISISCNTALANVTLPLLTAVFSENLTPLVLDLVPWAEHLVFPAGAYTFHGIVLEEVDARLWMVPLGQPPVPIEVQLSTQDTFSNSINVVEYPIEVAFGGSPFDATFDASLGVEGQFATADKLELTYALTFEINGFYGALSDLVCEDTTWKVTAIRLGGSPETTGVLWAQLALPGDAFDTSGTDSVSVPFVPGGAILSAAISTSNTNTTGGADAGR